MNKKPTRAEQMASHYGKKLEAVTGVKLKVYQDNNTEFESAELIRKRQLALAKLSTFKDM